MQIAEQLYVPCIKLHVLNTLKHDYYRLMLTQQYQMWLVKWRRSLIWMLAHLYYMRLSRKI